MATLMPDLLLNEFPGVSVVKGLLDKDGALGLSGDGCIDRLSPDYSILDEIAYKYPASDSYFFHATRGCGMDCQFCAVSSLEPEYVHYIPIKESMAEIDERYGPKRSLLLMDNNVLLSKDFDRIVDDLIELGFGAELRKGCRRRFVDFNQGLDSSLLTERKAKRLGELAIKPARVAFDHIEDADRYRRAIELCVKNGVRSLSNYILYNGEDFRGKGRSFKADTPQDLYARMRATLDLRDELRAKYGRVEMFSFPMRYIPLGATDRSFIGTHWSKKSLCAVQKMLNPTRGIVGCSTRAYFDVAFGGSVEEFMDNLEMPNDLLALRGHFVERAGESEGDRLIRLAQWESNQARINDWRRFHLSGDSSCWPLAEKA
jgi:hypothetical protein